LSAYSDWNDATVNASASRQGNRWLLNFFGGMARRPELSPDAFSLVVCHEVGHHFSGFPFKKGLQSTLTGSWASTEGQADYFATQACAKRLWRDQNKDIQNVPTQITEQCTLAHLETRERNLCQRIGVASVSVSSLVAALKSQPVPDLTTPSRDKVSSTLNNHSSAQCRLDTFMAGALCPVLFTQNGAIPGKRFLGLGQNSAQAEAEANKVSCVTLKKEKNSMSLEEETAEPEPLKTGRPRCWFSPQL
jgi:hypothetical protein